MQVLKLGNDLLRQKAVKIDKIDEKTVELAEHMFDVLNSERGVGLAAPQIGIMKRIFITCAQDDEPRVYINPSIIETSVDTVKIEEGCLSIPGIYTKVTRPESIKLQAWNLKGKPFTIEAGGMVARVIQHEYDHLEGVLFIDRLDEDKREKLLAKYREKEEILPQTRTAPQA